MTTIFVACNEGEAFKKIKIVAKPDCREELRNVRIFSDFIKEAGDFDAIGVAEIITNH
jgi:hypothetical protein